ESELVRLLGKNDDVEKRFKKHFGTGTSPDDFDDETPSTDEIKTLLDQQQEEYGSLTEESLKETLPEPFMGMKASSELAGLIRLHDSIDAGKIQEMNGRLENQ